MRDGDHPDAVVVASVDDAVRVSLYGTITVSIVAEWVGIGKARDRFQGLLERPLESRSCSRAAS
jgi:hypothetical protein